MQENQFQRFENLLEEFKQYIERVQGELKKFNVASTEVDVLEFEGKQYRRVYRKAQPGDVVVFERTNKPEWVTVGKPYKAEEIEGELMFVDDDGYHCFVYGGYITSHNFEDVIVYEPIQEKTPNQLRKEIIEKAKEFVENILGEYETFRITIGKYKNQNVRAVFRVNTNKRAVTALIYGAFSKELVFKGIAKCHPDDVFNEHIGKAIALGRALGLDVSEFEQAVQPTKPVIGMKFIDHRGDTREIVGKGFYFRESMKSAIDSPNVQKYSIKIINDTHAIYEEVN